ncbi:hypothetical protein FRC01_012805, partial [Tulasnella sp. 417]
TAAAGGARGDGRRVGSAPGSASTSEMGNSRTRSPFVLGALNSGSTADNLALSSGLVQILDFA